MIVSQIVFPLITYPIVTRALGAQQLGKINFTDSFVQLLFIIGSLGIPLYGLREMAIVKNEKEARSKLFSELFFLQVCFAVPSVICFWIIGSLSHFDHILLFIGLISLLSNYFTCEWFFQGTEAFFWVAIRSVLIRTVSTTLIFLFIKSPNDYSLYYFILTAAVVVTVLLNFSMILSKINFRFRNIHPFKHLKKINWIYACYALASLYAVFDSLLLGWLSTDKIVGYYSFGYRLVRMSSMLIPTLGVVFIPRIAFHHSSGNAEEIKKQVNTSQQIILLLGVPACLFFLILTPEIVSIFAGNGFIPTIAVIQILSPVPLLFALSHLAGTQILTSIKKEKVYFIFLITGSVLNILLNIILIPLFQERAAAFSNVFAEGFVTVGTLIYLRTQNILQFSFWLFIKCLIPALILLPVVYALRYLHLSAVTVLVLSIVISGIIYLAIQFRIAPKSTFNNLFSIHRNL